MESKNGSRDGGRQRTKGTKSNNYERDKWSPPSTSNPSSIRYFNEVPHAWCKKKCNGTLCGWNTTHSTSYHAAWTVDPNYSLKSICPTHQLVLAQQAATKPPRPPAARTRRKPCPFSHHRRQCCDGRCRQRGQRILPARGHRRRSAAAGPARPLSGTRQS